MAKLMLSQHSTTVGFNPRYSPPPHSTLQTAGLIPSPKVAPPVNHGAVLRKGGAFFVKTRSCLGFSIRAGPPIAMAAAPRWKQTAMLVIDMQNDFILPGGPMHVAGGEAIVPSMIRAVSAARERGIFVVWVVREHDPWGRDVEVFRRHLYADGKGPTSKGSKGAELVDGLVIEEGDYKLIKTRFSAFFATHLHSLLQTSGIKELVIVGVQTPNCIRQTVFDAVALDYQQVTVITDATAAASPEVHIDKEQRSARKTIHHSLKTCQRKFISKWSCDGWQPVAEKQFGTPEITVACSPQFIQHSHSS